MTTILTVFSKKNLTASFLLLLAIAFSSQALAAHADSNQDKNATRIIFLGTKGGPLLGPIRMQNSVLLVVDGRTFLLDAGSGTTHRLVQAGFFPNEVRDIFISHNHLDHNAGLAPLMAEAWLLGDQDFGGVSNTEDSPITIHGPSDTRQVFDGIMKYLAVVARISNNKGDIGNGHMLMPPKVFDIDTFDHDGVIYDHDGVKVSQVKNTHFQFPSGTPAYKAGDRSVSYRFDTPHGSVCYTGDTGPSKAVTKLFKGCDVLITEVIDLQAIRKLFEGHDMPSDEIDGLIQHMDTEHLTPEHIGEMAQKDNIKTVFLYHIVPTQTPYTDSTDFTAGVKKHFDGTVILSEDLMEYDLY